MNRQLYGMRIAGIASFAPPGMVTNDDIADRLWSEGQPVLAKLGRQPTRKEARVFQTSDEWIRRYIGFTERRFVAEGTGTIDLAAAAARLLLQRTGVTPDQIGGIIFGSVSPSYLYSPPDVALMHRTLGVPTWSGSLPRETLGADVSLACSTWTAALRLAYKLIDEVEYILVAGADAMSTTINWHDRAFACVLGDAGTATLCQRVDESEDWFGRERFFTWLDGSRAEVIVTPAGGSRHPLMQPEQLETYQHRLSMDGARVREDMVPFMSGPGIDAALVKAGLHLEDLDLLVLHEANRVLNEEIVIQLRARGFRGRMLDAGGRFGNTTSASIPLALSLNPEALQVGRTFDLEAFGGGYSKSSAIGTIRHPFPAWAEV